MRVRKGQDHSAYLYIRRMHFYILDLQLLENRLLSKLVSLILFENKWSIVEIQSRFQDKTKSLETEVIETTPLPLSQK